MENKKIDLPASLVTIDWLAHNIDEHDLIVLDVSVQFVPAPPYRVPMRDAYLAAHIPGAVFADLINDLTDPDSPLSVTRPTAERAATVFGQLGIGPRTTVVAYDCEYGQYAARLWWLLKAAGHDAGRGAGRWFAEVDRAGAYRRVGQRGSDPDNVHRYAAA